MAEREAALVGGGEGKEPVRYRWDEGGFYAVLTGRVKRHFLEKHGQGGVDPRKASVNRFVKVLFIIPYDQGLYVGGVWYV